MFIIVGNEEENIRTKYEFRKTDMMKKVFGYAEEELKRRVLQPKQKTLLIKSRELVIVFMIRTVWFFSSR